MSPILPGTGDAVEQRRFGRRHGIVAPVGGALEIGRRLAEERSCDHASDVERVDELSHDFTEIVEPFEPEMVLVRGDLEH